MQLDFSASSSRLEQVTNLLGVKSKGSGTHERRGTSHDLFRVLTR
jgi:hypothetical protein